MPYVTPKRRINFNFVLGLENYPNSSFESNIFNNNKHFVCQPRETKLPNSKHLKLVASLVLQAKI